MPVIYRIQLEPLLSLTANTIVYYQYLDDSVKKHLLSVDELHSMLALVLSTLLQ